jgi:hypothetical protein
MRRPLWFLLVLCLSSILPADWDRRADIQGNITDVAVFRAGTTLVVYLATDGAGVFVSTDGATWVSRSNGLDDLRIAAIAADPESGQFAKLVTRSNKVFVTSDTGANWSEDNYSGTGGLALIATPWTATDIAYTNDATTPSQWYTYLATRGAGIIRQNGWGGPWAPYNDVAGTKPDLVDINAVAAIPGGPGSLSRYTVLAAAADGVYRLDPTQATVGYWVFSKDFGGAPALSLALHQTNFALVGLGISTLSAQPGGVQFSPNIANDEWNMLCSGPPNEAFSAVDYRWNGTAAFDIVGGTPGGLYRIDDDYSGTCTGSGYHPYPFRGPVAAIGMASTAVANMGWAGGPGKGPVRFDPRAETYPVTNERTGIEDNNVVGLTLSPNYPSDSTIFAASGVAGLYKNTSLFTFPMTGCNTNPHWPGYFYRMIGDPDSWGIVPVRAVRTVPNYDNNAGYPFRTLFAASPGHGVLRSYDGGRSWGYANGDGNELAGAEVTDLLVDPSSANILYAAVYGKGVYRSTDGGASWALLAPSGLTNKKVLALALGGSTLYAGCRSASGEHGLWSYSTGWTSVTASLNLSVSVLATPKPSEWSTYPWVFAGTEANGVYGYKTSVPVSFTALSTNLPANARIYDLKVSPAFVTAQRLLAAVKPTNTTNGGVYWGTLVTTPSPSIAWSQITTGLTDRRVTAVAFNPDYGIGGEIFCGHAFKGVYIANLSGSGLQCNWKPAAGFYNVPPAIEALAVSPEDGRTVFAASSKDGVFISRDGGDTFRPWGAFESPVGSPGMPATISVAVTGTIYLNESFHDGGLPSGWVTVNGGSSGGRTWSTTNHCGRALGDMVAPTMLIDSYCEGAGKTQDDKLVTPELDTSGAQSLRLVHYSYWSGTTDATDYGYIKVCSSATGGSCDPVTGTSWVTVSTLSSGGHNLPDRAIDLTTRKGTGFKVMFHYVGAYDGFWAVDDVRLVDTGAPAAGRPNVVAGTRDDGIYTSPFGEDTYFGSFVPSSLTTGRIREIRYTNMAEDLRAADAKGGDWHSRDYGQTWTLISNFGGANIADMAFGSGLTLATEFERGLSGFVWGASSGKSLGTTLRAELCNNLGQAWYRLGGYSSVWTACPTSGLNVCEDFRSILQLTTTGHKDVLMGSTGIGSNPADPEWKGLYRAPSDCSAWTPSNEGLPCTTSGSDCLNTAQVWALWQNPDSGNPFILASVTDADHSDPAGDQGGVYFSDWWSYGKAWAKTNLPASEPGSVDLASSTGGTTIYTGLADDGVFSSVPASITVLNATAYFEAAAEACVGTSVTFSDYSAGQITEYAWDFGDGHSCAGPTGNTCFPTAWGPAHTFASAGAFTVEETVENGYGHKDDYSRPIAIRAELDVANTLRASKTTTPGQVRLTWTDITGETGYGVWGANAASGSDKSLRATLAANMVAYNTTEAYTYWRIQPLSGTYICGDGIVGGSW